MPYIKSIQINTERKRNFPFDIPGIRYANNLVLDGPITIIVGDNGTGKSTLLETIALKLNLPTINGFIGKNEAYEAARLLFDCIHFEWNMEIHSGFFFRAEDFSDFVNAVQNEKNKLRESMRDLEGEVPKNVIEKMMESQSFHLRQIREDYGNDMQAYSHGEAYMKIFDQRMKKKGIYILDEPEAALSPTKQIALISSIKELCKLGNIQFIMATHSPILMATPGAKIFEISENTMEEVAFEDTQHYRITKMFLNNPDHFLRYF